ncbi:DNA helicase II [Corynebacterium glutamicum MT]|uniref:DNA helicase II n=1 Tax=Corynebacterium glutamicum TaxID=1718 RepID=A0AB36I4Q3_CORGT|nr:UvrD-helicase domain-containing protein [Corynebacterium glutamicum]AGN18150.1 DNA helicase II [Corynebacterium glutamicum SCgG1]AGN21173.1 DNA helicase II [Corynebacterium glutamicum SCgG2]EGV39005.1 DNA helicase II [Corynebacterium glutamicum S9114]EOA63566.1 DNA helicase II [Corynebacterium glutamicum MT]EPP41892.1 DNA helicase II [Corynebacterium glutamicum Z188]
MNKMQLINAPAGSGKSTEIKRLVREWSVERPLDRLLCVTYTNRAADELKADISSPYIEVSTIHSFLSRFAQSLFSAREIVAYYFEIYGDAIKGRIENADENRKIEESNARYREELGDPLTFELVRESVEFLYYNERPFNTLYRGGLSHADLLSFVASCAKRYPNIYRRVSAKYRRVIIDEYQDTDVNVLEFFLNALHGSDTELHLYGDRMQQIYKTDPERFQDLINAFDVPRREVVNYRSTKAIVSVLNTIYNDESLRQVADSKVYGTVPRVHFSATPDDAVDQIADTDTLILSVHNSSIFSAIGSLELFNALKDLPDHGYNSRYPAATVLTEPDWEKVPSPLLRLLYGLLNLEGEHTRGHIGTVISTLRAYSKEFGEFTLHVHEDKALLATQLDELFEVMRDDNSNVKDVLEMLSGLPVTRAADVSGYLESEDYDALILVPFQQVRRLFDFRLSPTRSTQHGVKGESHEKVVFVAETSYSPVVGMKTLFDLWPKYELNLDSLEELLGKLSGVFRSAKEAIGVDIAKLNKETFPASAEAITAQARSTADALSESELFIELYGATYQAYLKKPGVTHAKKLFKLSPIEGLLASYRLFYVGCSRAKSELDVVIPLKEVSDIKATSEKLRKLGFEVIGGA